MYYLLTPSKNGLTFCSLYDSVRNGAFILQSHLCEYVWHCHRVERMPGTCTRFSFNAIWSVHSLLICSDCYPFAVAALAECPPWPWASVIFGPWLFVWNQVNVASWPLIRERQAQWAAKNNIWLACTEKFTDNWLIVIYENLHKWFSTLHICDNIPY